MPWTKLSTTPELVVYEDRYGNHYLRSTLTGRFLPKSYTPNYGRAGYGATINVTIT
jgi:hypothetical protein